MADRKNRYVLCDTVAKLYDNNGCFCLVDVADVPVLSEFTWYKTNKGYWRTKSMALHRFLLGMPKTYDGKQVDHINGDRSDNRRCNLRIVTNSQNQMNVGICKNNTSGATGVYFRKDRNKWKAGICVDGKQLWSGLYADFNDAVSERKRMEEKYFGQYRRK